MANDSWMTRSRMRIFLAVLAAVLLPLLAMTVFAIVTSRVAHREEIFLTAAIGVIFLGIVGFLAAQGAASYARNRRLLAEAERLNRDLAEKQRALEEANAELQTQQVELESQ
ncbi:MAG: hypothetical protein HZA23_02135 [Nitrospirae bacterium]|nr:hypothetical protein [Nitrospirota bacterium]